MHVEGGCKVWRYTPISKTKCTASNTCTRLLLPYSARQACPRACVQLLFLLPQMPKVVACRMFFLCKRSAVVSNLPLMCRPTGAYSQNQSSAVLFITAFCPYSCSCNCATDICWLNRFSLLFMSCCLACVRYALHDMRVHVTWVILLTDMVASACLHQHISLQSLLVSLVSTVT